MTILLTADGWVDNITNNPLGYWTAKADVVDGGILNQDIVLNSGTTVNTLGGNDSISGQSDGYAGIVNAGTINTGAGDDSISGQGGFAGIVNADTINTGAGVDIITGIGAVFGIRNYGIINTGPGADKINGVSTINGPSIGNYNTIDTGDGNDTITGQGFASGISNAGTIKTGNGNDTITEKGGSHGIINQVIIDTGDGNDTITGEGGLYGISNMKVGINDTITIGTIDTGDGNDFICGTSSTGIGIYNESTLDPITGSIIVGIIDTRDGNDTIIGQGEYYGISNSGTISLGAGNDKLTVSHTTSGGLDFGGDGSVFAGVGNDLISGFGTGKFYGGGGKDTLVLPQGSYTLGSATIGTETFTTFTDASNNIMNVTQFEVLQVGSKTYNFSSLPSNHIVTG